VTIGAREILRITDLLYAAALTDGDDSAGDLAWRAALDPMGLACGVSGSVVLGLIRGRYEFARSVLVRVDATAADQYITYYAARDPVLEPALATAASGVLLFSEALMPRAQFVRSEFYTDWMCRRGWFAGAAVTLVDHGTSRCVLYLAREQRSGSFSADDVHTLNALIPHVQRATALAIRLIEHRAERDGAFSTMNSTSAPIMIVDRRAVPVYVNGAAERLLRTADRVTTEPARAQTRGALRGTSESDTRVLRALIAAACDSDAEGRLRKSLTQPSRHASGGSIVLRDTLKRAALMINVTPMPIAAQRERSLFDHVLPPGARSRAILTFVDLAPSATITSADGALRTCLCQSFGLTSTEAAVAIDIAGGMGLASVAGHRHVSLATVRTHAAHIYQKAGVRGQIELAALVARLASQLAWLT
jgi:DNA-binding CsgD family transcriptional regulator/PAS domain-containing protein